MKNKIDYNKKTLFINLDEAGYVTLEYQGKTYEKRVFNFCTEPIRIAYSSRKVGIVVIDTESATHTIDLREFAKDIVTGFDIDKIDFDRVVLKDGPYNGTREFNDKCIIRQVHDFVFYKQNYERLETLQVLDLSTPAGGYGKFVYSTVKNKFIESVLQFTNEKRKYEMLYLLFANAQDFWEGMQEAEEYIKKVENEYE